MTMLWEPPVARLAEALRDRFQLEMLIETGTFRGLSTRWAAERFRRVITIDVSTEFRDEAVAACAMHQNVQFITGDSRHWLGRVLLQQVEDPVLCWLDAHAAPGLFGPEDNWPILHEIAAICDAGVWSRLKHFVLIDDAHCFLPGTPYPACPTLEAVQTMAGIGDYECWVVGDTDVIAMMPLEMADKARAIFAE